VQRRITTSPSLVVDNSLSSTSSLSFLARSSSSPSPATSQLSPYLSTGANALTIMPSFPPHQSPTLHDSSSNYSSSDSLSDFSISTAHTGHSAWTSLKRQDKHSPPEPRSSSDKTQYSHHDYPYPRSSAETYASTSPSFEQLDEDLPPFEEPEYQYRAPLSTAIPSTSQDFADHFPSTQRLSIRHDDATDDGNMNLRVDTEARTSHGGKVDLTLFHLRMHDLKRREFSLRRYCRDSGREICHSTRKYTKRSVIRRPGLQRSMSNALSSLRSKSDNKTATKSGLKRQDSGYDSMSDEEVHNETTPPQSPRDNGSIPIPSNTIRVEFSNYAHLEVKRRGTKSSKRYDFEYWGTKYAWKRASMHSGTFQEISYHLVNTESSASIAHIVPIPLSVSETREEDARGG